MPAERAANVKVRDTAEATELLTEIEGRNGEIAKGLAGEYSAILCRELQFVGRLC